MRISGCAVLATGNLFVNAEYVQSTSTPTRPKSRKKKPLKKVLWQVAFYLSFQNSASLYSVQGSLYVLLHQR